MYMSPLAWCPVARAYVALDEPIRECAATHRCPTGECSLRTQFLPRPAQAAEQPESAAAARPASKA